MLLSAGLRMGWWYEYAPLGPLSQLTLCQIFRFYWIFFQRARWIVPPVLLYTASLVTGSLALHQLATPGNTLKTDSLAQWFIVYRTISLSSSLILTSLIAGRLLHYHRRGRLLYSNPKSPLFSVAAILIESASLETVASLVYIITVGIRSSLQNVFLPVLGQIQIIAPMLIIYRVARGRDTVSMTSNFTTELSFDHGTQPTLSIRINTDNLSTPSSDISTSPAKSTRGLFDSPRTPLPPYTGRQYWHHEWKSGTIPPSSSMVLPHTAEVKVGARRTTWGV
ncbi:hypothetical protein BC834DRAFT_244098 [Gloeopeniophorella convolvens]|nr:hypothetical protein BC834DRAFT_244098 [Gloeopeniophorella convolvens]